MPAGRPRKYTKKRMREINDYIREYTQREEIPTVAGCACELKMHRQQMYEYPEFSDAIKELVTKKEKVLETGALTGHLNSTMAIFSLKQIGWKDKQEHEVSGKDGEPFSIKIEVVKPDAD
ncbi:MAG: hypothetical protein EOM18_15315 [Clostridia bacterium]|nr:hypothetical protein [Clostridia bacterium]